MIKAVFFDVDNTLYDWPTRQWIPSAFKAIKVMQERGVKAFICTARPYASFKEFGGFDLGIHWNGIIASCGAYVSLGNRVLRFLTMNPQNVRKLCKIATRNSLTMELVTAKTRYLIAPGNTFLENYHGTYSDTVPPVHRYRGEGVSGALLFAPEEYDHLFKNELPELSYFRFHDCGVDISEVEHLKGEGMAFLMKDLGLTKDEVLSFGDDLQDIPMGESSTFICVGNGKEEVKAAADYVCPPIVENGIEFALRKYGVIE